MQSLTSIVFTAYPIISHTSKSDTLKVTSGFLFVESNCLHPIFFSQASFFSSFDFGQSPIFSWHQEFVFLGFLSKFLEWLLCWFFFSQPLRGSGGSCVSTCLFGFSFFVFYHYFLNKHIYHDLTYHLHWDNSKLYISSSDLWSSTTTWKSFHFYVSEWSQHYPPPSVRKMFANVLMKAWKHPELFFSPCIFSH